MIERLEKKFENKSITRISFDKGFYSKLNVEKLQKSKIVQIILPKKGKKNKEEKARESEPAFVELRHKQ